MKIDYKKGLAVLGVLFFFFIQDASAQTLTLKIFNSQTFKLEKEIVLPQSAGFSSLSAVDLEGDGRDEIVLGAGKGNPPLVWIFRSDGSLLNSFLAYDYNFQGGVSLAPFDLEGDGKEEILTGAGFGGGPHIRVFNKSGQEKMSFFAGDKSLRSGVEVATGNIWGSGEKEIITSTGSGVQNEIKIWDKKGQSLGVPIKPGFTEGTARVSTIDLGGDGISEILASPVFENKSEIKIYRGDSSLINQFRAYPYNFYGGINLIAADLDSQRGDEIITAPGLTGGPLLHILDGFGRIRNSFFSYDKLFRGGMKITIADLEGNGSLKIITIPERVKIEGRTDLYKYVEININKQTLKQFQNGYLLGEYLVSTGTWYTPTPLGIFKVLNKEREAYSTAYNLYMPYWMGFTWEGAGIHGLPFWKTGENIIYEGVGHLGQRVSHGCVRLAVEAAKRIYNWIEIGATVIVK